MYLKYLKENGLEDSIEEKAKYAIHLINETYFYVNDIESFSEKIYLCSFPPHSGGWWVKFQVPEVIEYERYDRENKGQYDTKAGNVLDVDGRGYPIGMDVCTVRSYPAKCIEKFFLYKFINLLEYDCPDRTDRLYRNFLDFTVNLD